MRKLYASILFFLFVSFGFAQVDGDYRWANTSSGFWNTPGKWEIRSGGAWVPTTNVPGITNNITYTVFLEYNGGGFINLRNDIYVLPTGKIDIANGMESITLGVGINATFVGKIFLFGEIILQGSNSLMRIGTGNSVIDVKPGGKISDNSNAGGINNLSGTDGIVLNSSSTGITGSLISNSSVEGTFEQYIADDQWHLIAPVFGGVTAGDYADGVHDAYLRAYSNPGAGWGDYIYDETASLTSGLGYEIWQTTDFTYSGSGTFITGPKTLTIGTGGSVNADWNLIGNPYPCGLDWGTVSSRTNCLGSSFYVYDTLNGYRAHDGTTGAGSVGDVDAPSGIIPAMQAFFVKSNGGGNIAIDNSNKVHADVKFYKSKNRLPEYVSNLVRLNASYQDQNFNIVFYQREDATNGADIAYDAEILFNNDPEFMDFYSFAGVRPSMINVYNEYPYIVPLGINIPEMGGDLTISLTEFENGDGYFNVTLEDLETGDMINLFEDSYTINLSQGGSINERFLLHLNSTVGIDDIVKGSMDIYSYNNTVYVKDELNSEKEILVYDILGKIVYSGHSSDDLYTIDLFEPAGYYIIEVITKDQKIVEKVYIK